jgi:hypothetical protein
VDPPRNTARSEQLDPICKKLKMDALLPNRAIVRKEIELPNVWASNTLALEPIITRAYTEKLLPSRLNARIETVEANRTCSFADDRPKLLPPARANCRNDKLEPRVANPRTDAELAKRENARKLRELPNKIACFTLVDFCGAATTVFP